MKDNDKSVTKECRKKTKKNESGHIISSNISSNKKKKVNIKKLKEIRDRRSLRAPKRKKKKLDWSKIARNEKTSFSFSPTDKEREEMFSVLKLTMHNPAKKLLVKKLGDGFAVAYQRYRRALEREQGKRGCFLVSDSSMYNAQQGGIRCIQKEVTPFEVLRYWHEHIGDFKDGSLKIPPLTWVSSEQAIETVACSDLNAKKEKPSFGNSFSGKELDPKVRRLLKKFGVEEQEEGFLLQIQNTACAISKGASFYIPKRIKRAAEYLAKVYFSK